MTDLVEQIARLISQGDNARMSPMQTAQRIVELMGRDDALVELLREVLHQPGMVYSHVPGGWRERAAAAIKPAQEPSGESTAR